MIKVHEVVVPVWCFHSVVWTFFVFSCGSVIVDFKMKFNQSAVVSEVLDVLKTAAKEDKFDGFKVDPNSIEQVSAAPTDTSGTKGTTV